jgi:hypothetical protein
MGVCVGKSDAPYISLIHITPRPGGLGVPLTISRKQEPLVPAAIPVVG